MTTYSIGQHISDLNSTFNPIVGNKYLTKIDTKIKPYIVSGDFDKKCYKDYYIKPNIEDFNFLPNTNYYLKIKVARNIAFNLNLDIKLVQESNQNIDITDCYQIIRRIVIPSVGNGNIGHTKIILFKNPNNENEILVKKVLVLEENENPTVPPHSIGDVAYDPFYNRYYIFPKTANYFQSLNLLTKTRISDFTDIILTHSWEQKSSDNKFFEIEVVFSPRLTDFNAIFLQLVRTQLDDDLYVENINNQQDIYGFTLGDLKDDDIELYSLTNLIPKESGINSFSTIGVWGPPGLMMGINGEEIKIGSNGYYELNDFEITKLGVVAKNKNDSFSIDYQYKNISSNEGG